MLSVFGRRRPWVPDASVVPLTGSILLFAALGCGGLSRPVVTSLPPVQPSAQPTKYAVVVSCASTPDVTAPSIDQVCNSTAQPGLTSLVDFSGDTLLARINIGTGGPRWLGLSNNGATAYVVNADGTVESFLASSSTGTPLENKSVNTSTLPSTPPALPNTLLFTTNFLYVSQPGRNSVEVLGTAANAAPNAVLEVPITANPVNLVGNASTQRIYAISQGSGNASCPTSGSNGTVTAIETTTNTITSVLPTGPCPVYGVMSADNRRTFILNQGGNTITVIDSQQNQIDANFPNGITVGNGPIWADIYNNGSLLAVANSRDNTVSLINISLDSFGNDGPDFGNTVATVPVGPNPSSLAFLQDGTQLFVANRNDPTDGGNPANIGNIAYNGSVNAINLTTYTVDQTIPLPQEPCTTSTSGMCNVHPISLAATTGTPLGRVYVVSPDTNVLTIIRTDNDTIYENLQLAGSGVQVRVTLP